MSKEERKALAARYPLNPNPVTSVIRSDGTATLKRKNGAIVVIPDVANAKKPRSKTVISTEYTGDGRLKRNFSDGSFSFMEINPRDAKAPPRNPLPLPGAKG